MDENKLGDQSESKSSGEQLPSYLNPVSDWCPLIGGLCVEENCIKWTECEIPIASALPGNIQNIKVWRCLDRWQSCQMQMILNMTGSMIQLLTQFVVNTQPKGGLNSTIDLRQFKK